MWAVSVCSVDGQRVGFGDNSKMFTMQSLIAPFLYGLAIEEHGAQLIHSIVGQETSGGQYNKISLDASRRPHNPMINTGGNMSHHYESYI